MLGATVAASASHVASGLRSGLAERTGAADWAADWAAHALIVAGVPKAAQPRRIPRVYDLRVRHDVDHARYTNQH